MSEGEIVMQGRRLGGREVEEVRLLVSEHPGWSRNPTVGSNIDD